MDIVASIDHRNNIVHYRITGAIVWDEIKSIVKDQTHDYLPLNTLWDLHKADLSNVSIDNIREMLALAKTITCREGGKSAVVVANQTDYARVEPYLTLAADSDDKLPMQTRVFLSTEDAEAWINASS